MVVDVGAAGAACASGHLRAVLSGFDVSAGLQSYYRRVESQGTAEFTVRNAGDDCIGALMSVGYSTADVTATASDYAGVAGRTPNLNDEAHPEDDPAAPTSHTVQVTLHNDADTPVVESVQVRLSDPVGAILIEPFMAPLYIVDDDGGSRVGLDTYPYSQSETFASVQIPVFRGGDASLPSGPISYSFGPTGANPAAPGTDFHGQAGSVMFAAGEREKLIPFSIVNDTAGEPPETLQITVTGAEVPGGSSATTFTIVDNEENVAPSSRLHHPRHRWKYKKSDFRIREVHIFSQDNPGGAGVVDSDFALRRNMKNGNCLWLTKDGWQKKDCTNRQWLDTRYDDVGQLWFYRPKQLKSSVGTRVKDYTAFSRASDGAGNVEKDFHEKRNANTFEVKRARKR